MASSASRRSTPSATKPEATLDLPNLGIPIYLNQQVVFDLLAILDDGFSRLRAIKTSSEESESSKHGIGGSIGLSNVFTLLGVSFSGERTKERGINKQTEVSQEKVHTPTSLFAKLRSILEQEHQMRIIESADALTTIRSGDFVEFKAVLRKNPLVDTIEGFKTLMEMAALFSNSPGTQKQKGNAKPQSQMAPIMRQMDGMLAALTQFRSIELIGELLQAPQVKAVIASRLDYFNQGDTSEIIDGEFQILGKVTRVVQSSEQEPINLLRKTPFGRLDQRLLQGLEEAIAAAPEAGLRTPEFVTEICGPALLIIPIAIYA